MKIIYVICILSLLISWLPREAEARNNIIIGGLSLSYDYDDRQYESQDSEQAALDREREAQRQLARAQESQRAEEMLSEEEEDRALRQQLEANVGDDLTDPDEGDDLVDQERAERERMLALLKERELQREEERDLAAQQEEGRLQAEQRESTAELLVQDAVYDDQDIRRVILSPYVRFTSTGEVDEIELYYAPGFSYDQDDYDTETDQALSVTAYRYFEQEWMVQLSDNFIYSDDSTLTEDRPDPEDPEAPPLEQATVAREDRSQLSNEPGRRRYKTNELSMLSEYTYRPGSVFGLGYTWNILRNEYTGIGGWEDYDRHDFMSSLSYQFNPRWILDFTGHYIKGDYDPPDEDVVEAVGEAVSGLGIDIDPTVDSTLLSNDLQEYRVDMGLVSNIFPHDPLLLTYGFIGTDYEQPLREDSVIHELTLSWEHELGPRMRFALGGGPSYEKTTNQDANWDYNAHGDWSYDLLHTYFGLAFEKGYDQSNFSGTHQRGFIDYWLFSGNIAHDFTPNLRTSFLVSYRDENREEPARALAAVLDSEDPLQTLEEQDLQELAQYNTRLYTAGVDCSYTFLRYFTASATYTFSHQDSDRIGDDYDDHRVFLTISMEKELFRW